MTHRVLVPRRAASPLPAFGADFDAFDRVFEGLWSGFPKALAASQSTWQPRLDVAETAAEFRVDVELPGLENEDIEVSLEDGVLTIRGERRSEEIEDGTHLHRRESRRGSFTRSLRLPVEVDGEAVKAVYKNGVLHVTLPKAPEAQPRTIPIDVS